MGSQQLAQILFYKHIVGAAQHQGVDVARCAAKAAHGLGMGLQQMHDLRLRSHCLIGQSTLFDGQGQAVASLHLKMRLALHAGQQTRELVAGHGAAGGHHAHLASLAQGHGGFERGLYTYQRQLRMACAQLMYGGGGGGVAGHHQRLDLVLRQQMLGDGVCALTDVQIGFFAVRRVRVVGQVHKALVRQFFLQGLQHAQAADAAVKHANGVCWIGAHGVSGLKKGRLRGLVEQGCISQRSHQCP